MYKEKASYGMEFPRKTAVFLSMVYLTLRNLLLFDVFIYQMRLAAELFLVCLLFVALECNSCEANKRAPARVHGNESIPTNYSFTICLFCFPQKNKKSKILDGLL